jgi:Helix-turn-helix domain
MSLRIVKDQELHERPGEIVRAEHDADHPYLVVQKKLIRDKELPFTLRGFLCFILAQPTDWHSRVDVLARDAGISRTTCYKYLAALEKAGYVKRTIMTRRIDHGHFQSATFYTVFEERKAKPSASYRSSMKHIGAGVPDAAIPF